MQTENAGIGPWLKLSTSGHAHVVDSLGLDIVSGVFPVGSILPGDFALLTRFKVSRTVLREAMKTLAAKGLITARARIGTRINEVSSWNMFDRDILKWHFAGKCDRSFCQQLGEIRHGIEPQAARLFAAGDRRDDAERLRQFVLSFRPEDVRPVVQSRFALEFHIRILEASGNLFIRNFADAIEVALALVFRDLPNGIRADVADEMQRVRQTVAKAICAGNAGSASESMARLVALESSQIS